MFVKICPACNAASPEDQMLCQSCGNYLGGVAVVEQRTRPAPQPESRQALQTCRLEFSGVSYPVRSGDVVGQAHASSKAQVQLAGFPGVEYISRRHCRFDLVEGSWFVTALQEALNPTHLNKTLLAPGGKVRVRDGDLLTLAAVSCTVRIP